MILAWLGMASRDRLAAEIGGLDNPFQDGLGGFFDAGLAAARQPIVQRTFTLEAG